MAVYQAGAGGQKAVVEVKRRRKDKISLVVPSVYRWYIRREQKLILDRSKLEDNQDDDEDAYLCGLLGAGMLE